MRASFALPATLLALSFSCSELRAQEFPHIPPDFHNRYVEVPIDHRHPEQGTFQLYYELSANFSFDQETVFVIQDAQQIVRGVDMLGKEHELPGSLNLVLIEHRGRRHSPLDLAGEDGGVDWEKVYHLMASHQAVKDIEAVRQHLFRKHSETKISLLGGSGGGLLVHEYLARYPARATRAFTLVAPNPQVMERMGHPTSRFLVDGLTETDPALPGMLETVLSRESIEREELLYLLFRLPYRDPKASEASARIIRELYEGDTTSYDEYKKKRGFRFSGYNLGSQMERMGYGMPLRLLEGLGPYVLGPEPEHVDPGYFLVHSSSGPLISLIRERGLPAPSSPPLASYRYVRAEVFNFAGRWDHVSSWEPAVELADWFPHYAYFIADDTHGMEDHDECIRGLRNAFLLHGLESTQLAEARRSDQCREWTPGGE